jgi:hypothetical protein
MSADALGLKAISVSTIAMLPINLLRMLSGLSFHFPASLGCVPHMTIARLNPPEIRYIKLGRGGCWVDASLDRGELHFGFRDVPHEIALKGDREEIRRFYLAQGRTAGVATGFAREVLDFYFLPSSTLWITFARDRLWWCFSDPEVVPLEKSGYNGARMRRTIDGWHGCDCLGRELHVNTLSTRLTKTAAFRATICKVDSRDYLLRRLNGDEDPAVNTIRRAQQTLLRSIEELVAGLHWRDFEVLADLVFARLGWQRVSVLGETMADVDIVLEQPITREKGVVQVKSRAGQAELDAFTGAARAMGCARAWFVVHTPTTALPSPNSTIEVWSRQQIAKVVQQAGLVEWLIDRFR